MQNISTPAAGYSSDVRALSTQTRYEVAVFQQRVEGPCLEHVPASNNENAMEEAGFRVVDLNTFFAPDLFWVWLEDFDT